VPEEGLFLGLLAEEGADGVVEALEDGGEEKFVLRGGANHVEEQVHISLVHDGESFQQSYLAVSLVGLIKHELLEILLLPQRRVDGLVVVLGQEPLAVVVHYDDGFDVVKRWTVSHFVYLN